MHIFRTGGFDMLLACDIGNSAIKFAVFDNSDNAMVFDFSLSSVRRTPDELQMMIKSMLSGSGFYERLDASVISSVVPDIFPYVRTALSAVCSRDPFIITTGTHTGFPIRTESHAQLGADIVSNAAAALSILSGPLVIVDMGTATTITAVSAECELLGTIIAPGVQISLDALHQSAALLSEVMPSRPAQLIGRNSQDSISSGVINGAIIMIDGFIRNLREELCPNGEKLSLVSTGGLAPTVIPYCRNKFTYVHNLTLKGAARLYYNNNK